MMEVIPSNGGPPGNDDNPNDKEALATNPPILTRTVVPAQGKAETLVTMVPSTAAQKYLHNFLDRQVSSISRSWMVVKLTTRNSTTISLNSSSIALGAARAPHLTMSFMSGALQSVSVPCQESEVATLIPAGCALTQSYGKLGTFEFTQASLMYGTEYEFAVDALGVDGSWRGWSDSLTVRTLNFSVATTVTEDIDPACTDGVTLTDATGTISRVLKRAVTSTTCLWRLEPAQFDADSSTSGAATSDAMLFVTFEPTEDKGGLVSDAAFQVGAKLFSPIQPSDVVAHLNSGISAIRVVNGGTSCAGSGMAYWNVILNPESGAKARAISINGVITQVIVLQQGSGITSAVTATIESDSCTGVELEVLSGASTPYK